MATSRLPHFQSDIARARDLVALGQGMAALTVGRVDASDTYRASLVLAVSALDHYFHGVVIDRATEIMLGRLSGSGKAARVGLSFEAVSQIVTAPSPALRELTARTHVAARLGTETFQRPDDIADALALVGIPKIWASAFGSAAGTAKVALGTIVTRRNRIVHQSDSDPLTPGAITPLNDADALAAIDTIEATVLVIDPHC